MISHNPPVFHILRQMNGIHTLTHYPMSLRSTLILFSKLHTPQSKYSVFLRFPDIIFEHISRFPST